MNYSMASSFLVFLLCIIGNVNHSCCKGFHVVFLLKKIVETYRILSVSSSLKKIIKERIFLKYICVFAIVALEQKQGNKSSGSGCHLRSEPLLFAFNGLSLAVIFMEHTTAL